MAPAADTEDLGRYGGEDGDSRRARRREQLLDAGLELFGTRGYAASSVKAVCQEAGLTERYFYESFRDREDLLFAVYERVANEVLATAVVSAEAAPADVEARSRAGLEAFFGILTEDVRKAKVQSFEVVGVSERLETRRRQTIHAFAEYLARSMLTLQGAPLNPAIDVQLLSVGVVGATNEILIEWVLGQTSATVKDLIEQCTMMYVAMAAGALVDPS